MQAGPSPSPALFAPGQPVTVHHQKPWKRGRPIRMTGNVVSFDGERLLLVRQFRRPGAPYDDLQTRQRTGDWGTIELRRDAWVCRRRYFRKDRSLIGESYNVQTPTVFLPGEARYVDLEIDVAFVPHLPDPVQILDTEDLEDTERAGHLQHGVAQSARWIAYELAARLRSWGGHGDPDWDVRPPRVTR